MHPREPDPVKFLVGAIYRVDLALEEATRELERTYGEIDFRGDPVPFDATEYYSSEMGSPLTRMFFSFRHLMSPGGLVPMKLRCGEIEEATGENGRRKVNLDPGYMDFGKFVLASFKYKPNKIYLAQGVYADPTLFFEQGAFHPYPWTFPDMRGSAHHETFLRIRGLYREAMRGAGGDRG